MSFPHTPKPEVVAAAARPEPETARYAHEPRNTDPRAAAQHSQRAARGPDGSLCASGW